MGDARRLEPDADFLEEIAALGAEKARRCMQCASCSAVCELAPDGEPFPRKEMLGVQWGLKERLESSLDPWLCYYCGRCSTYCPRGAEPGETMMGLRRWLTTRYDVTGLSRLFYLSWRAEAAALLLVALLTGAGFVAYGLSQGDIRIYDGPGAFMPSEMVHRFDWCLASVLTLFLGVNALRMWWFAVGRRGDVRPTLAMYVRNAFLLPLHSLTQKRYARCEERGVWLRHLWLMFSYATMFVLIMFFLEYMQRGPGIVWPAHAFGYLASVGLLVTLLWAIVGRWRKARAQHRHSHESDWVFLVLLLVVVLTGILQHALHRLGFPVAANVAYVAHMMCVVPMLALEVPFGKWSHLAYRPLAVYLDAVRREALARTTSPGSGSVGRS